MKQAESLLSQKPEPASAGFVSLDPDFESGATLCRFKTQPALAGFVSIDPDLESGGKLSFTEPFPHLPTQVFAGGAVLARTINSVANFSTRGSC